MMIIISDAGEHILHCWQIGGASSSGRTVPCWGNYAIENITDLVVEEETFPGPPPEIYNPDRFSRIVCQIPRNRPQY